jgi:hypothetical protein
LKKQSQTNPIYPIYRPLAGNPTTPVPFPDACCPVLSRKFETTTFNRALFEKTNPILKGQNKRKVIYKKEI